MQGEVERHWPVWFRVRGGDKTGERGNRELMRDEEGERGMEIYNGWEDVFIMGARLELCSWVEGRRAEGEGMGGAVSLPWVFRLETLPTDIYNITHTVGFHLKVLPHKTKWIWGYWTRLWQTNWTMDGSRSKRHNNLYWAFNYSLMDKYHGTVKLICPSVFFNRTAIFVKLHLCER